VNPGLLLPVPVKNVPVAEGNTKVC
jgi:hypothetical protein